jgi:cohesin complex subunit SA-1/2
VDGLLTPQEEEDGERTKKLMTVLPRLFAKHQADVSRIAGILSIPERMNLALYLDMRKSTVSPKHEQPSIRR